MRNHEIRTFFLAILALLSLISATRQRPVKRSPTPPDLDIHRSLAVTDPAILDGFSFERVMNTLVERGGIRGMTATHLYQQWFDTQNRRPGLAVADGPHCDDFLVDGQPSFNGFPRRCPTPEGARATSEPFVPPAYIPLALINRFDLTPVDGSDCGQYRIIFALTAKKSFVDKIHLIFEGVLPNPNRSAGLAGCRPVAQFWADLSGVESISERRARLENFFFNGIAGFSPLLHPDHYSGASGGSIRSLHYTFNASPHLGPRFYQFRLEKRCHGDACTLRMEPDVLENVPSARLFDGRNESPSADRFRREFLRHVQTLAVGDVNGFFMKIPAEFSVAESDALEAGFRYSVEFISALFSPAGQQFHDAIQAELRRIGSPLSPRHIIARAETQTCSGCHFVAGPIGDGLRWPLAWPLFQHVGEEFLEPGEAGPRFEVSPAMRNVFLPHRAEILRRYLTTGEPPIHSNAATLGGGRGVH
jgi:hypothetical protein